MIIVEKPATWSESVLGYWLSIQSQRDAVHLDDIKMQPYDYTNPCIYLNITLKFRKVLTIITKKHKSCRYFMFKTLR